MMFPEIAARTVARAASLSFLSTRHSSSSAPGFTLRSRLVPPGFPLLPLFFPLFHRLRCRCRFLPSGTDIVLRMRAISPYDTPAAGSSRPTNGRGRAPRVNEKKANRHGRRQLDREVADYASSAARATVLLRSQGHQGGTSFSRRRPAPGDRRTWRGAASHPGSSVEPCVPSNIR